MKKNLSILPLAATMLMLAPLASCGAKSGVKTIGICQLVQHEALNAATLGFMDAVKAGLGEENVSFDLQNAAGESAICTTIANKFVSQHVDLIMANATPALQAAANSTLSIPILGTSITEYGTALGIDDFSGIVGGNISGTSDLAPLDEQAAMISELFPEVSKVGLLYCSSEANSLYQVRTVSSLLEEEGLTATGYSFTDSNDISSVLNKAISEVDLLYVPTDNVAASCVKTIDAICRPAKIPVVAGEEGLCKGCGTVTLSISYYNLGKKTGEMAVDVLKNGADISKMAIAYDENPVKKYNPSICQELGVTVPEGFIAIEE